MMDLFINTLTGTVFELRVSPFETILSIKSKLQSLEGIPISQQHLIWRSKELEDEFCLHDYAIKSGTTLTLVLAMRDGPINMRRVSVEEPSMEEMAEYMDANRDEIWDKIMNDDKQVTLLVFRDGDQLNFFRVYDRGDGTLTPYSESLSPESIVNVGAEDDNPQDVKAKNEDNTMTRDKMKLLRSKMEEKSCKKNPCPPSSGKPSTSTLAKRRIHFSEPSRSVLSRHGVIPKTESKLNNYEGTPSPDKFDLISSKASISTTKPALPPIQKGKGASKEAITEMLPSEGRTSSSFQSNVAECNTERSFSTTGCNSSASSKVCGYRRLPSIADTEKASKASEKHDSHAPNKGRHRILKPLGRLDRNDANELFSEVKSPPLHNVKDPFQYDNTAQDTELSEAQLSQLLSNPAEYEKYKKLLNWVRPKSNNSENENISKLPKTSLRSSSRNRRKTPDGRRSATKLRSSKIHQHNTRLPSVQKEKRHPPSLNGKRKPRCFSCAKKLGIATTYQCRCGSQFCASHRYPETHTCTYDYKSEGRKLLEKNNPVVTAPKLPKI